MFFKFDDYRDSDNSYSRRRYRVNESNTFFDDVEKKLKLVLGELKDLRDDAIEPADSPEDMKMPLGINVQGKMKWIDLHEIEKYIAK